MPLDRINSAMRISQHAGMTHTEVSAGSFRLTLFARVLDPAAPVVVYIEGDGLAWKSRSEPSHDPTPRNPVGLKLAGIDRSPNVIYLARPCQYSWSAKCSATYWTGRRFSEEVIAAMDQALDVLKPPGVAVHLVGYSGGAAIAILMAARRGDVASIRTVAGNLDSEGVNRAHKVSAMPHSLNPIDEASRVSHIPQRHLVGGMDPVVPPFIADGYVRRSGYDRCAKIVLITAASHEDGWEKVWQDAWATLPRCP